MKITVNQKYNMAHIEGEGFEMHVSGVESVRPGETLKRQGFVLRQKDNMVIKNVSILSDTPIELTFCGEMPE